MPVAEAGIVTAPLTTGNHVLNGSCAEPFTSRNEEFMKVEATAQRSFESGVDLFAIVTALKTTELDPRPEPVTVIVCEQP